MLSVLLSLRKHYCCFLHAVWSNLLHSCHQSENNQRPDRWWSKTVQAAQPLSLAGWDQYCTHLWKHKSTLSPSFMWIFSVSNVFISVNPLKAPHRIQLPAAASELQRTWLMLKLNWCELFCPLTDTHTSLPYESHLFAWCWINNYLFCCTSVYHFEMKSSVFPLNLHTWV